MRRTRRLLPNHANQPRTAVRTFSRRLRDRAIVLFETVIIKVLQRYWRFSRGLTMGAQGVVLKPDNAVLLIRHAYRPGWHFPGGGVEKRESALVALKRELIEEAGVTFDDAPELFGLYSHHPVYPGDHVALFVVRSWTQSHVPKPNVEIAEQGFFQLDALPDGTHPSTRRRLIEVLQSGARSDVW